MSHVERQVSKARRRLWLNRWLVLWGWSLSAAAAGWTLSWLAGRLFGHALPMQWLALGGVGLSLIGASIALVLRRDSRLAAAAALDQGAGLRERVSTGLQIDLNEQDPFARAVIADAERSMAGLDARKFVPLRWAPSLSFSVIVILVALLSLLLPPNLLVDEEARAKDGDRLQRAVQAARVVSRPLSVMAKVAEKTEDPELAKQVKELSEAIAERKLEDADVIRRKAIKQLDRLSETLRNKVQEDRFAALRESKKLLSKMGQEADSKTELGKLMQNLGEGNFEAAQESIRKVQEELAKKSQEGKVDPEQVKQMQKQLEDLAKKMQEASQDQQSKRELQNAGLSEQEAQRVLDALAKKDPEQLAKTAKELAERLKQQGGMSQEQVEKMLQKMQQRQEASKQCQKMGEKMGGAAKQLEQGKPEDASQQMGEAGEMLSEMEQLDQALNDIESQMSELDEARDDLNKDGEDEERKDELECQGCHGTGFRKDGSPCPHCKGSGKGNRGRGFGERKRNDAAETDTVNEKANVKTTKGGSIIGQQFVKGRQLQGKSEVEIYETAGAAEIDATDSLNKDRIPRQYRRGVKRYFDRLGESLVDGGAAKKDDAKGEGEAKPSESGDGKPEKAAEPASGENAKERPDGETAKPSSDQKPQS